MFILPLAHVKKAIKKPSVTQNLSSSVRTLGMVVGIGYEVNNIGCNNRYNPCRQVFQKVEKRRDDNAFDVLLKKGFQYTRLDRALLLTVRLFAAAAKKQLLIIGYVACAFGSFHGKTISRIGLEILPVF